MIRTHQVVALLVGLAVAAPAAAAPVRKPPAKKAPAKKGAKSTAAEEAALERSLGAGTEEAAPPAATAAPSKGAGKGPKKVVPPVSLDEPSVTDGPKKQAAPEAESTADAAWHGIDVQLGVGVFSRKLSYTDDIFKALRPYSLPLGPALSLRASVLPLAVGKDLHIGAYLRGDMAIGIESKNPAGQAFRSSAGVAEIALAAQMRMDDLSLGLRLGYGTQWFSAESVTGSRGETIDPGIPSVNHTYLMGTLTAAYAVAPAFELNGAFTYLAGQGAGALSSVDWFPNASSSGFDVQVGGIYKMSPLVGLGVDANYRRIALNMNSVPGNSKVAGGATDDTPGARLFLNLHW